MPNDATNSYYLMLVYHLLLQKSEDPHTHTSERRVELGMHSMLQTRPLPFKREIWIPPFRKPTKWNRKMGKCVHYGELIGSKAVGKLSRKSWTLMLWQNSLAQYTSIPIGPHIFYCLY